MELMNLLLKRRSVRNYTGDPVPREKLEAILEAGLSSASGRNRKPWELVVVSDRDILEKLSHCRTGAARMLEKAGCAILVFADPEKTDVWTEDCSIVMSNMHLMAASLGLGSCWIRDGFVLQKTGNRQRASAGDFWVFLRNMRWRQFFLWEFRRRFRNHTNRRN